MIYLVKHLEKPYDIVVSSVSDLPENDNYSIERHSEYNRYLSDDYLFANILTAAITTDSNTSEIYQLVSDLYFTNRDSILNKFKTKFIIAAVELKDDNSKEVVHASSYINLMYDLTEYNKLPENGPMHHYEIYNYNSESFEIFIRKEDAIKKLNQYMNDLLVEYKPNIVKEFWSSEQFLEFINNNQ